jgi:hypothetical protein
MPFVTVGEIYFGAEKIRMERCGPARIIGAALWLCRYPLLRPEGHPILESNQMDVHAKRRVAGEIIPDFLW